MLDIGSGYGWLATRHCSELLPSSKLECVDENYSPSMIAELPSRSPGTLFRSAIADGSFDLILALDVVEHVPNDADFVRKIRFL